MTPLDEFASEVDPTCQDGLTVVQVDDGDWVITFDRQPAVTIHAAIFGEHACVLAQQLLAELRLRMRVVS